MEIDNSGANIFRRCPLEYYESALKPTQEGLGLEPKPHGFEVSALDLGGREHELLEEYYNELKGTPIQPYPESLNEALEMEAQLIITAYRAKYPQEEFEIVDVERPFRVVLPDLCPHCYQKDMLKNIDDKQFLCERCGYFFPRGRHTYVGKIDVTFRMLGMGVLDIMDHKTEKRRSNSNRPQKWAARDQASLYLWAAKAIYKPEEIGRFHVNVLKRPSEKFQEPPIFPDRQTLERTPEQIETAVRDLVFIADDIERYKHIFGDKITWPSNRENCDSGWGQCDFYLPHTFGWSEEIRENRYQPKKPYLKLEGIPIIQP